MAIKLREKQGITVFGISGNVRIGKGDVELRDAFKQRLQQGDRKFVFDMTGVGFIDSAGISETVACYKRAQELGGSLKILLKSDGKPEQVFHITSLDRVFEIFYDEQEALGSF